MSRLGEVLFWKIAMRPGRPMAFGKIGDAFLFGLPGNPVAVMVTFHQFVRDALLFMSGREAAEMPLLKAAAAKPCARCRGGPSINADPVQGRGRVEGAHHRPAGLGVLRSMSEANFFIVLEHERGAVKSGEQVDVQLFEGLA